MTYFTAGVVIPLHTFCMSHTQKTITNLNTTAMKLVIADHIQSQTAAFRSEGQEVYQVLEQAMHAAQPFELSFERLETCSTQFLNASIGRLYRTFTPADIKSLMTITGIMPEDEILPEMIERTIDKALRPEIYAELMEKTLAYA